MSTLAKSTSTTLKACGEVDLLITMWSPVSLRIFDNRTAESRSPGTGAGAAPEPELAAGAGAARSGSRGRGGGGRCRRRGRRERQPDVSRWQSM